jgi:uncharacterized membrane protein YkoI
MPIHRINRAVLSGAVALGLAAGVAGVAGAVTGQSGPSATTDADNEHDDAKVTSSITVDDSQEVDDATEAAQLKQLATVTADEASAAAASSVGGTAGKVELENEDGNVVYSVEVTDAAGTLHDVVVDAGNAKILANEVDQPDANEGSEGNDAHEQEGQGETAD